MARTTIERQKAAAEIAERLAGRDQEGTEWRDAAPLRRVAEAFVAASAAEAALAQAVAEARAEGCSWAAIAAMLGVSKQTAQARYGTERDRA